MQLTTILTIENEFQLIHNKLSVNTNIPAELPINFDPDDFHPAPAPALSRLYCRPPCPSTPPFVRPPLRDDVVCIYSKQENNNYPQSMKCDS